MNAEPSPFAQTHAVVTGASSGIGRATAIELARLGVERMVVHFNQNERGASETAAELKSLGCEPILLSCDLSDLNAIDRFASSCFASLGQISTWVNNAGVDVLTGNLASRSFSEKLERLVQVDVLGTIQLSRLVVDRLRQIALPLPPSIAFIGWDQANEGMEGDAGQMFAPVKAAVTAFGKSLAQSAAPHIRVNVVEPGWIRTAWGEQTEGYWDQRAKNQSLMGCWGNPEDVARAIAFACNPANSFLNGQTIRINGGWNRRFEI